MKSILSRSVVLFSVQFQIPHALSVDYESTSFVQLGGKRAKIAGSKKKQNKKEGEEDFTGTLHDVFKKTTDFVKKIKIFDHVQKDKIDELESELEQFQDEFLANKDKIVDLDRMKEGAARLKDVAFKSDMLVDGNYKLLDKLCGVTFRFIKEIEKSHDVDTKFPNISYKFDELRSELKVFRSDFLSEKNDFVDEEKLRAGKSRLAEIRKMAEKLGEEVREASKEKAKQKQKKMKESRNEANNKQPSEKEYNESVEKQRQLELEEEEAKQEQEAKQAKKKAKKDRQKKNKEERNAARQQQELEEQQKKIDDQERILKEKQIEKEEKERVRKEAEKLKEEQYEAELKKAKAERESKASVFTSYKQLVKNREIDLSKFVEDVISQGNEIVEEEAPEPKVDSPYVLVDPPPVVSELSVSAPTFTPPSRVPVFHFDRDGSGLRNDFMDDKFLKKQKLHENKLLFAQQQFHEAQQRHQERMDELNQMILDKETELEKAENDRPYLHLNCRDLEISQTRQGQDSDDFVVVDRGDSDSPYSFTSSRPPSPPEEQEKEEEEHNKHKKKKAKNQERRRKQRQEKAQQCMEKNLPKIVAELISENQIATQTRNFPNQSFFEQFVDELFQRQKQSQRQKFNFAQDRFFQEEQKQLDRVNELQKRIDSRK